MPFQDGISLKNMIPAMKEGLENLKVFAYRGSMPAPPCYETFTWLVFRRPVKINPVTVVFFCQTFIFAKMSKQSKIFAIWRFSNLPMQCCLNYKQRVFSL